MKGLGCKKYTFSNGEIIKNKKLLQVGECREETWEVGGTVKMEATTKQ